MSPIEFAGLLKDAVLAGVGVATVVIATFGLSTWNRQLKGQADFDAARGLAKATYALRNAIEICRSPLILAREFPEGYPYRLGDHERNAGAWSHVYSARWEPVMQALQAFDTAALEAEALWGVTARERTDALRGLLQQLRASMAAVIDDSRSGGESFKSDREFGKNMRANTAASPRSEDALSLSIGSAVQGIEAILKPHLRRL